MKHLIWTMLLLCMTALAAERALPDLSLADKEGAVTTQATLKRATPWALLVVDAGKPQTNATLVRLQKKEGDWGGGLAVVVIGNQEAFTALIKSNEKLTGVRWYRDTGTNMMKTLHLPGLPAVLGMNADNQIVWQSIGREEEVIPTCATCP